MDAFDADALIYAATPGHPLGRRVAALFRQASPGPQGRFIGVGSVLLIPEILAKPLRDGATSAAQSLSSLLSRLDLRPVDRTTAELAAIVAARYKLRCADATHLATAISMGATRFITSNTRDYSPAVTEIDITHPADLPDMA
jgi:predicted nucleic acid-binding protein